MHSLFPLADYQTEMARRQDEMACAARSHLAHQCPGRQKAGFNLSLQLANFLWLLIPFIKH
jgi:hypothetical protein